MPTSKEIKLGATSPFCRLIQFIRTLQNISRYFCHQSATTMSDGVHFSELSIFGYKPAFQTESASIKSWFITFLCDAIRDCPFGLVHVPFAVVSTMVRDACQFPDWFWVTLGAFLVFVLCCFHVFCGGLRLVC